MTTTVIGLFDDPIAARRALEALRDGPMALHDIAIITRDTASGKAVDNNTDIGAGEGAAVGAAWGALVGGVASFLIPGLGPFLAGGALVAALTGAATGAVVGGVTAALADFSGIPEAEAHQFEQLVRAGMTLLAVRTHAEDAAEVRRVMAQSGASELHQDDTPARAGVRVASFDAQGTRVHDTHPGVEPVNPSAAPTPLVEPPLVERTGLMAGPSTQTDQPSPGDAAWSGGEWVGEGQGQGPHDTGTEHARQWVGEGQGPGEAGQAQPSGGEWVGEGQGQGPHDTGAEHARQWVGEGQGEPPATRTISDPPNEPPHTEHSVHDPQRWTHAEQDQRPVSATDDPQIARMQNLPDQAEQMLRPTRLT